MARYSAMHDPSATPVGGAEYLSTKLTELRAKVGDSKLLTVAAGDLIGGSTFISGPSTTSRRSRA
jgi:5'-nucleotidase